MYDYQDGFTFGGVSSSSLNLIVLGNPVPLMPEISEQSEEMPGLDGGYDFGIQYKAKIIPVTVRLLNSTSKADYKAKLRNLAAILNPRLGAKELIFDDEPDKMYLARLTENFTPERVGMISDIFTLSFICYDPFAYGVTEKTESGLSFDVENLGSHVATPTFFITTGAGAGSVKVTHPDETIDEIVFKSTTIAGTYIINTKEKTSIVGIEGAYRYLEKEEYPTLQPNINQIEATGAVTDVEIRYRDTWL